jgi:prepilin signal peptidase PulO-like enzyme (type II secretory pathway)
MVLINPTTLIICITASVVLGAGFGVLITWLFGKFPESWLQDYGVKETDPDYRVSKRMRWIPEGLAACLICAICYIVAVIFCGNSYITTFKPLHLLVIVLLIPDLILVMMSDKLNRIIPDQFSAYIAVVGVLSVVSDLTEGSIWFTPDAKWYMPLLNKIIASVVGGGVVWLIGGVSITFFGKESIGMGDMRLLFATGLITGCYGIIVLIYVAIFTALIWAIPLLIRKRKRIRREEAMIRASDNPRKARLELQREKAKIHFADDPDYMAFGPFLALGCGVFCIMEPFFYDRMIGIITVLGVHF